MFNENKLNKVESIKTPEKPEVHGSIEYWFDRVINGKETGDISKESNELMMLEGLKKEVPNLCSATLERTCNLACPFCLYQTEKSSKATSEKNNAEGVILNIVKQLPSLEDSPRDAEDSDKEPMFLHEGRILKPWHIELFKKIRQARPDVKLGLIDNGTYTKLLDKFDDLRLDWLDISIDGTEEVHNQQRQPGVKNPIAFKDAIDGLRKARLVADKVTSLMTLTNINYNNIKATADLVFSENVIAPPDLKHGGKMNHVDEFHLTTMSPAREENEPFEISQKYLNSDGRPGDLEEFEIAWKQIKEVFEKYGFDGQSQKVFLRIYRHWDLEKLAYTVGTEKFLSAIKEAEQNIGRITFKIDGVSVTFSPLSVWPSETFLIDADGAYRVAYSLRYTLEELKRGRDIKGNDISFYTVNQLNSQSKFTENYHKGAEQWWGTLGKKFLNEELKMFERIRGFK